MDKMSTQEKCQYCDHRALNEVIVQCPDGSVTFIVCDVCYLNIAEIVTNIQNKEKDNER